MTQPVTGPLHRRLLLALQAELQSALRNDRAVADHPTLKGTASEGRWRKVLEMHLPRRYRVTQGVVVDYSGGQSDQIDIIIHDAHYCPLFRDLEGTSYVPAESVYAVLESKQTFDASHLSAAADKAQSVRMLARTSGAIIDRGVPRAARGLYPILAGIVALEADWSDGLGDTFAGQLARHTGDSALDIGCALDAGAFEVPAGAPASAVLVHPAADALIAFFLVLLRRLQALGTASVIDWQAYERLP